MRQLISIGLLLGGCSAASLTFSAPVYAQDGQARSYHIPPQALSTALSAYAEQSGIDVIFSADALRGKRSEGLQGAYQPEAALGRLLRGSGLTHRSGPSGNIIVEPAQAAFAREGEGGGVSAADDGDRNAEIVVTGTSIRGVAPVGSSLIQVDEQYIQDRGVQSTGALFASIPQLDSFGTRPAALDAPRASTPISLRTLGPGATLTLLNSHRLVGVGTLRTTTDPTTLPIAAIARVEVVADGASAVYGSDAIAGVVNVILRKNLDGLDARASVGVADGYSQELVSLVGGKTWDTGSILVGVQYDRNNHLIGFERDYATSNFASVGGADGRSFNTALPNVTVGGVSYGFNGTDFNTTQNIVDPAREADLIPASRKWNAILNAEQHVGDNVRLFADAHYSDQRTVIHGSPTSGTLNFTLPSTNPFFRSPVPGATSVQVNMGFHDLLGPYKDDIVDAKEWGASGGAEVELSDKWSGQLMANYGRSHTSVFTTGGGISVNSPAFIAAVNSTDPSTAYDPFTGRTSAATRTSILGTFDNPESTQKLTQVSGSLNGSLFALPGGDLKLAAGGEFRHESYVVGTVNSGRNVWSAYGELYAPVIGEDSNIPLVRRLELSGAVRHDQYSDFGSTTNPKFGFTWEVFEGLKLRGSYGKSFHAPSLGDLRAMDDNYFFLPATPGGGFFTPQGGPQNLLLLSGGNPNLKPEKATTWSVGGDFNPTFAPRLRLNATYFDIKYTDIVAPFGGAGLAFLSPALTPLFVVFNPTEAQIDAAIVGLSSRAFPRGIPGLTGPGDTDLIFDARRANLGASRTKGLDFGTSYDFDLAGGKLLADVNGTYLFTKKTAFAPGFPFNDDLETLVLPRLRVRSHLGWRSDRFRANAFWSRLSGYNNTAVTPVQRVSSFNSVDVNFGINIPSTGIGKNFDIQFDIQNLFDEEPPRLLSGNGISTLSSPLGRLFQVSVRTEF